MSDTLSIPGIADRYIIEREIGQVGMATVYLARDTTHDRPVAIGVDRFRSEIKTTAALHHPHILLLFDSGEAGSPDGKYFYLASPRRIADLGRTPTLVRVDHWFTDLKGKLTQ